MATTAAGWPYVDDEDFPLEYPVVSQALANKMETFDTATTVALTSANGYTGSLDLVYNGTTAHLNGDVARASGSSLYILNAGAIPAAARPAVAAANTIMSLNGTAMGPHFFAAVDVDGSLQLLFPTGQSQAWNTATVIGVALSWAV